MTQNLINLAGREFESTSGNVYCHPNTNKSLEIGGYSVYDNDCLIYDLEAHRRLYPCSIKLFEAYSMANDSKYGEFKIYWFYEERKVPVAPYEVLIYGYEPKYHSEMTVNEYFTEEEIELLREYLEKAHHSKLYVQEEILPIPNNLLPFSAIGSSSTYSIIKADENNIECKHIETIEDYILLSEEKGYSLPFKVSGYYSLENSA